MEKALLTIKEASEYLSLSCSKTRELFKTNSWSLKIGNKWYANKSMLDRWLVVQCKISH